MAPTDNATGNRPPRDEPTVHLTVSQAVVRFLANQYTERDGQRTVHTLVPALLNQWFPYDPVLEIRPMSLDGVQLEPIASRPASALGKLPGHRLRGEASYRLFAERGDQVGGSRDDGRTGRDDRVGAPAELVLHEGAHR